MIIVDNCILSSFAKIKRIGLLRYFPEIHTTPGVIEEILRSDIIEIIDPISEATEKWLKLDSYTNYQRIHDLQKRCSALSVVDCELILFCAENRAILLSDDTKLLGIAEKEFDIQTFDLCDILIALKNKDKLTRNEITSIIADLEKKDRYLFSNDSLKMLGFS